MILGCRYNAFPAPHEPIDYRFMIDSTGKGDGDRFWQEVVFSGSSYVKVHSFKKAEEGAAAIKIMILSDKAGNRRSEFLSDFHQN